MAKKKNRNRKRWVFFLKKKTKSELITEQLICCTEMWKRYNKLSSIVFAHRTALGKCGVPRIMDFVRIWKFFHIWSVGNEVHRLPAKKKVFGVSDLPASKQEMRLWCSKRTKLIFGFLSEFPVSLVGKLLWREPNKKRLSASRPRCHAPDSLWRSTWEGGHTYNNDDDKTNATFHRDVLRAARPKICLMCIEPKYYQSSSACIAT